MKKFAMLPAEILHKARRRGPAAAGALALLQLADADYDGTVRSTARELTALLGYRDWRAARRILEELRREGLAEINYTPAGTTVRLLCGGNAAVSVGRDTTQALENAQRIVGQSPTRPLSPRPPYPVSEYLINKKTEKRINNAPQNAEKGVCDGETATASGQKTAGGAADAAKRKKGQSGEPFDGKTPFKRYGAWYVKTYLPQVYRAATPQSAAAWYAVNGRRINALLRLAENEEGFEPLLLAREVTRRVAGQMQRAADKNPDMAVWGLQAVVNNFDAHLDEVLKEMRRRESAAAREEN